MYLRSTDDVDRRVGGQAQRERGGEERPPLAVAVARGRAESRQSYGQAYGPDSRPLPGSGLGPVFDGPKHVR